MTLKQKAFIKETIATGNPTEAVRRVYNIGSKGGSKTKEQARKTATAIGLENLAKPSIREKIEKYLPDDLIFKSLQDDIKQKPRNRCSELQLASKIKGLLSDKLDITSKGLKITFDNAFKPKEDAQNANLSKKKPKDE